MGEEDPTPRYLYVSEKDCYYDTHKKEYLTYREVHERLAGETIGYVVEQPEK